MYSLTFRLPDKSNLHRGLAGRYGHISLLPRFNKNSSNFGNVQNETPPPGGVI